MNTKKINKEFCITDNTVNVYEYRCLTEGLNLDEVKKNPIGYFNHGTSEFPRDAGVLVKWEDFRLDKDKVFAKPVINLSHPRGLKTVNEIESGFLNAASVGKIVVLEASNDPKLKMKGQTKPTVTKWFPREISLVDIPGNYNAFANLFDKSNSELNLIDIERYLLEKDIETLDKSKILNALNLTDGNEEIIIAKIQNLMAMSYKSSQLEKQLKDLTEGSEYKNKTWDDLYSSDELETVRQKYPKIYEDKRKAKFPNLKI